MMDTQELYTRLRALQEKKGYYFNKDRRLTFELLDGLLLNRQRYGYMSCPCRLASGVREQDADIICPCLYRVPDVEEYGSCYCGLYVSAEWNAGKLPVVVVPERRPMEKVFF
jgi:ferredoxin-thioredoxin reductase catalytic chain